MSLQSRLRGWYVDSIEVATVYDREHRLICQCIGYGAMSTSGMTRIDEAEEAKAKAALISAAPELLSSAILESMFPFTREEHEHRAVTFAQTLGYQNDMPIAEFARQYRNAAIIKASGTTNHV